MVKKAVMWVWQLPQHLLGLVVWGVTRAKKSTVTGIDIWEWDSRMGVSLGELVFVGKHCTMNTIKHEHGHTLQSHYLGPLYLLIIGLPSVTGNLLHRVIKFDYYKQPWEKWADKLGGVRR